MKVYIALWHAGPTAFAFDLCALWRRLYVLRKVVVCKIGHRSVNFLSSTILDSLCERCRRGKASIALLHVRLLVVSLGLLLVSRFIRYTRTPVVLGARRSFDVLHGLLVLVTQLVHGMRDEKTTAAVIIR